MRRGLHGVDKCLAGTVALEASKFFGGNDNDFITAMNGYVLRPLAAHQPHQFAKARLGVLKKPVTTARP